MKIAVTYENGQVFQHFGHTEEFKVYDTEDKKILSSQVVGTGGSGHEALAVFLKNLGVEVLICGGIGGGARTALAQAGIELYPGASGDADQAVEALLSGSLVYDPNTVCSHHHEGGEHNCRLPRYLTKPRQRRSEWDMAGSDGISRVSAVFRGKSLLTNKMRII